MNLIQEGLSTRLAAKRLNVRPRTVDKHVERALRKLCARSRIEAVAILNTRLHETGHRAGHAEETRRRD